MHACVKRPNCLDKSTHSDFRSDATTLLDIMDGTVAWNLLNEVSLAANVHLYYTLTSGASVVMKYSSSYYICSGCLHSFHFASAFVDPSLSRQQNVGHHRQIWSTGITPQCGWVELSLNRRTRWSVITVSYNGSRVLEKRSLQPALEGAQRQFGGA